MYHSPHQSPPHSPGSSILLLTFPSGCTLNSNTLVFDLSTPLFVLHYSPPPNATMLAAHLSHLYRAIAIFPTILLIATSPRPSTNVSYHPSHATHRACRSLLHLSPSSPLLFHSTSANSFTPCRTSETPCPRLPPRRARRPESRSSERRRIRMRPSGEYDVAHTILSPRPPRHARET